MARQKKHVNPRQAEFDMAKCNEDALKNHPHMEAGPEQKVFTPMGTNVDVRLFRKLADGPRHGKGSTISVDQVGHTLVVDYYTFGAKLYAKYEREAQRLVFFVEDEEGTQKIGEYQR